jgi:AcrR family transcriptional regulator
VDQIVAAADVTPADFERHFATKDVAIVIARDRMLAMGRVVTSTSHLQQQASAVRRRVLTQALAGRMGFDSQDRRVQRAVTMWSAIAAGAYIGQLHMPPNYVPRHDDWLSERMVANLSETFAEVMGAAPWREDD